MQDFDKNNKNAVTSGKIYKVGFYISNVAVWMLLIVHFDFDMYSFSREVKWMLTAVVALPALIGLFFGTLYVHAAKGIRLFASKLPL